MKKWKIILICAGSAAVLAGGGYGIYRIIKANGDPVEVTKVAYLNTGWWGNESTATYGVITANASQEVHLDEDQLIKKVYVKEGDKVKIGDKLLSYDTTLLKLELEAEKLNRKTLELELQGQENDLVKLKAITPIPDSADEASLIQTQVEILAETESKTQESGTETNTEGMSESEAQTETPASEEETVQTEPESQTEPETQTEETEEEEPSPLDKIKARKKLDYKSKPYKGSGVKDDPYVFFCVDGAVIESSFMNKILGFNEAGTSKKNGGMNGDGKGCYAQLEIREGDSVSGGFVKSVSINGTSKSDKAYAPGISWTFTSEGMTKNELDVNEPEQGGDDDDWNYGDDDDWDDSDTYTVSELKEAISTKEDEIQDTKLDIREAKLKVKQAKRKVSEATIRATINGVVKTVGDPEVGQIDDEAFLSLNSDQGLYVKGTISELKLDSIEVGAVVDGMSQESSTSFMATITEISEYPDSGNNYYGWSEGNSNVSNYPFLAYIEDSKGLNNYESVSLNIQMNGEDNTDTIYLDKSYIRSENGQSYVWITDADKKLKKQYVKTGKTLYGSTVEVKEGLSQEDFIAFPYGKNIKEGAKTTNADGEDEDASNADSGDDLDEEFEDSPDEGLDEDLGSGTVGLE